MGATWTDPQGNRRPGTVIESETFADPKLGEVIAITYVSPNTAPGALAAESIRMELWIGGRANDRRLESLEQAQQGMAALRAKYL